MKKLPVHPSADLFPMFSEDELYELANDIKQNGQIHPIVTGNNNDGKLYLIDGRNRLAACKMAGVEPNVVHHDGDVNTYINSANNMRRELTKGQKAMSFAVMFEDDELNKGGRGNKAFPEGTVSRKMLSYARKVLKVLPGLRDNVLSGAVGLNDAYEQVQEFERDANREKGISESLQTTAPELYDRVQAEELTLHEAQVLNAENNEKLHARLRNANSCVDQLYDALELTMQSTIDFETLLESRKESKRQGIEIKKHDKKTMSRIFKDIDTKMALLKESLK